MACSFAGLLSSYETVPLVKVTAIALLLLCVAVSASAQGSTPPNAGTGDSTCLEALQTGQCVLLWEVETTSATGSSSQSNNNTTPNIMAKLDYQWHPAKSRPTKHSLLPQLTKLLSDQAAQDANTNQFLAGLLSKARADSKSGRTLLQADAVRKANDLLKDRFSDHLTGHVDFQTGYTQAVTTSKVQTTGTSTSCPGGTSTSSGTCTSAVPQDAFIAELAGRIGWSTGVNDQKVYGEFGLGARGSFQYLIPTNKVVQSGGLNYIDLSSTNPQDAVGFYEATGHFRLGQPGHNQTRAKDDPNTANSSDLLVLEGGYQNNRGLQQLIASDPLLNTRNRYVARFYVHPEIIKANHTQLTMGMEYSGGINGGPHVIQLFFGTTLNPAKLFKGGN